MGYYIRTVALISIMAMASAAQTLNRINVVALDSQGQPVADLTTADFQIWEDGKPRPVVYSHFTGDKPPVAVLRAAREYSNRAGKSSPVTVVLIDLLNDRLLSGAVMADEIARALKDVESGEGLYLYLLTTQGNLYPIHPLPKTGGAEVLAAGEPWTRSLGPTLQGTLKEMLGLKPVDDRDIEVRFRVTTNALKDLAQQMWQIPGRKNLVWVTHGIPIGGVPISQDLRVDFSVRLRDFCQELQKAQIMVYPVAQSIQGAEAAVGTESEQTLTEFAGITGGRKYRSGGVGGAIRQAVADSRANYQIAYDSAAQNPDGKHHKLRITCSRKDVHLQTALELYGAAPLFPPEEVERLVFDSAVRSPFDATEIGLRARLSMEPRTRESVRLDVRIDPADLLLRQARGRRAGKVTYLFAAYEAARVDAPGPPVPLEISLTPEQYEAVLRDGIEFHRTFPVRANVVRVRVIVVDGELGAIGSVTVPMQN